MYSSIQLFIPGFLLILVPTVSAIPPDAGVEQSTAAANPSRHTQPREILGYVAAISEGFKVPISFEWSYVTENGSPAEYPSFPFSFSKGETLSRVLDRLCEASGGSMQWGRIEGILSVWPTESGGTRDSLLDQRISLELKGVSVWQAMLEVCKAVNSATASERFLIPEANPIQDEFAPPTQLRDSGVISLNEQDMSAREAICRIMAISPLRMNFWYYNTDVVSSSEEKRRSSKLSIRAFDENHRLMRDVPGPTRLRNETFRWYEEAQSVIPTQSSTESSTHDQ